MELKLDKKTDTKTNVYGFVLEFTLYGVLGWLYEAVATLLTCDVFENRGFLHMCVLPIYGLFAFGVILLFRNKKYGVIKTFFMSMAIVTALEYIAAVVIELVLKKKLWDYSNWFCNLDGRVALVSSVIFGVCCVLLLKIMHPTIQNVLNNKMRAGVVKTLGVGMLFIYVADLLWTMTEYL